MLLVNVFQFFEVFKHYSKKSGDIQTCRSYIFLRQLKKIGFKHFSFFFFQMSYSSQFNSQIPHSVARDDGLDCRCCSAIDVLAQNSAFVWQVDTMAELRAKTSMAELWSMIILKRLKFSQSVFDITMCTFRKKNWS